MNAISSQNMAQMPDLTRWAFRFYKVIDQLQAEGLPFKHSQCPGCGKSMWKSGAFICCPSCGGQSTEFGGFFPQMDPWKPEPAGITEDRKTWTALCAQAETRMNELLNED